MNNAMKPQPSTSRGTGSTTTTHPFLLSRQTPR